MKVFTSPPDNATLAPEWGLKPPRAVPITYGARAIFENGRVDFLWDRTCIVGGSEEERKAFSDWLNKHIRTIVEKLVKRYSLLPSDAAVVSHHQAGFEIQISPRRSYGYLYIGVWPEE